MLTTFYLSFKVTPGDENLVDRRIEGAQAHCWVVEDDPISATTKATYHIRKSGWKITAKITPPIKVLLEYFRGNDLGEKSFMEAQEFGIATFFAAYSSVKEVQTDVPTRQTQKEEFDLHEFIGIQRAIRSKGMCLFYEKTETCQQIIDAHSIQKKGALSRIARDGYVYAVSGKFTDIKKNKGKFILAKTHVNSMSTFRGLCQTHDNFVFRPIDSAPLQPTDEQVFLYAYRCILRERFAKECAVGLYSEQLNVFRGTAATRELLEGVRDGNRWGLENLKDQQSHFNTSHKENRFDDIRYVIFESSHPPTAVFSGALFPDWGFSGEPLQNLANFTRFLDLITFSFAPTSSGWAFLFAWHRVSDHTCRSFISTLQGAMKANRAVEDLLFGMVVRGCENSAFCPKWVERLAMKDKLELEEALSHGADMLKLTASDYLQSGIAEIHEWQFDSVQDNL